MSTDIQKEASAKHVLHPTTFNTAVGLASGALGAVEEYNRTKDVHRTDMIEHQIENLKGRKDGGDFNVMDRVRLQKLEVDKKIQGLREKHPTLTVALNTLANAAVGYATGSAAQRTYGPKPTIPGKVAVAHVGHQFLTIPGIIGTASGAAQGIERSADGKPLEVAGRMGLGGVGGGLGASYGAQLGAMGGATAGIGLGSILGPGGATVLGGAGLLGGIVGGGVLGYKGGKHTANWVGDKMFGRPQHVVAAKEQALGKQASPEDVLIAGLDLVAQTTGRTANELTLEEKLAFVESFTDAYRQGYEEKLAFSIPMDGFQEGVPAEERAAQILETYKQNAEADIPWHSGARMGAVGGGILGTAAGFGGAVGGLSPGKALGMGAAVGLPISAGLMALQHHMAKKNQGHAAESAQQSEDDILQHLRHIDLDSLQSKDSFPDSGVRNQAYKSIDHLMKGASVREKVAILSAIGGGVYGTLKGDKQDQSGRGALGGALGGVVGELGAGALQGLSGGRIHPEALMPLAWSLGALGAYGGTNLALRKEEPAAVAPEIKEAMVAGSSEAMETGSNPYTQSHASTAPIPPQQNTQSPPQQYGAPAAPSTFDKIKPYLMPAGLLAGGAMAGHLGTKGWGKFMMGNEKQQAIAARVLDVHPEQAIKALTGSGASNDVRAGVRHLAHGMSVDDIAKMSPEAIKQHGSSYEAAKSFLDGPTAQTVKIGEIDYAAMQPENLSVEQAIRPYTGGMAGMVGGGVAGHLARRGSSIAPIAGSLMGYAAGNYMGRHTLSPEEQVALREFEAQIAQEPPVMEQKVAEDAGLMETMHNYRWPLALGTATAGGLLGMGLYKGMGSGLAQASETAATATRGLGSRIAETANQGVDALRDRLSQLQMSQLAST